MAHNDILQGDPNTAEPDPAERQNSQIRSPPTAPFPQTDAAEPAHHPKQPPEKTRSSRRKSKKKQPAATNNISHPKSKQANNDILLGDLFMPEKTIMSGDLTPKLDFSELTLIEGPNSARNCDRLPSSLQGCEGYLTSLPLKAPNCDWKDTKSICDMVNVLTHPNAEVVLQIQPEKESDREVGSPLKLYNAREEPMKTLLKKTSVCHKTAPLFFGKLVRPGEIRFYSVDKKIYAVSAGRWWLMSYKAWWKSKTFVDVDEINFEQAKIIRVPPGCVGCIVDQSVPVLLDVGTHVFNSGTVRNEGTVDLSKKTYFNNVDYHYIRVPRGSYSKVWVEKKTGTSKAVISRLLSEGEHYIKSSLFRFDGYCSVDREYINHGSLHVIQVQEGFVAKVIHDDSPRLLSEGLHVIDSSFFTYKGMVDIAKTDVIIHETITILRVNLGLIALAWKDSNPLFIDKPGLYEWNSPDFQFVGFKNVEERLIQLGSKKIVLVHTGAVGVTYDDGLLKILNHGRHIIDSPTHIFHRFLSIQQRSIRLTYFSAHAKAMKSNMIREATAQKLGSSKISTSHLVSHEHDLVVCETKDLVKIGLGADVFYSIEDPEKCISKIDTDELEDLVRETAVATLTNIVRSTALNEIAQSSEGSAGSPPGGREQDDNDQEGGMQSGTGAFFEKAHDIFLDKLHDDFLFRYGVDIANIRIENFKIIDEELSNQISRHVLTTAKIENEMANLEGNSLISTTRERTDANVKKINAQAEAETRKTKADAENQRRIDAALAEAEALKIRTTAQADAQATEILTKAKAEAEAIRLKAAAEAERNEMISRTKLGMQESLLREYSSIVTECSRGVQKVVYMDPSINRDSPFALGSLQNLNYDLHSLSKLGIAEAQVNTPPPRVRNGNN